MKYQKSRVPAIDPGNYVTLLGQLQKYGLDLEKNGSNKRAVWYKIWDSNRTHCILCTFDVDVRLVLERLKNGERFESIDLFAPRSRIPSEGLPGDKQCVVCNEFGGVPCPNMIKQARDARIQLHPHQFIHPGRCRKSLREKLEYAKRHRTTAA